MVCLTRTCTKDWIYPSVDGSSSTSSLSITQNKIGGAKRSNASNTDNASFQDFNVPSSLQNRSALRSQVLSQSRTGGAISVSCRMIL